MHTRRRPGTPSHSPAHRPDRTRRLPGGRGAWDASRTSAADAASTGAASTLGAAACVAEALEGRKLLSVVALNLDPAQSSLTVSGYALSPDNQFQRQIDPTNPTANSLVTSYFGTLVADISSAGISFPGGSMIEANDSGNWNPGEPEGENPPDITQRDPANYGVTFAGPSNAGAMRDAIFDGIGARRAIAADGTFASTDIEAEVRQGFIDYVLTDATVGSGRANAVTSDGPMNMGAPGRLAVDGNRMATLTLPVDVSFMLESGAQPGVQDVLIRFTGQLVAKGALPAVAVDARHVFYNNSPDDANTPGADPADDGAIDPDKVALVPNGTLTPANITAYSKGINGVMVDVANLLPSEFQNLGPDDFAVRSTPVGGGGSWSAGPAPTSITVRQGAGANGSDRVTLIWPDGAVTNRWLEVRLLAKPDTGVASPDVFAFGNLIGDSNGDKKVDVADLGTLATRFGTQTADGPDAGDFNNDGTVNVADLGDLATNFGKTLANPPAVGAAVAQSQSAGDAPVVTTVETRRKRAAARYGA